jgi:hypothetical protein
VAVTVSVDVSPEKIVEGFAVIVTVVTGAVFTVTVTVAVIVPPAPVAVAVYVVVAVGLTDVVPPAAARVTLVPVPVTVTVVAFVAVTVKVEDAPELIVVGLAAMVTVGGVFFTGLLATQPIINSETAKLGIAPKRIRVKEWRKRAWFKGFSFISLKGEQEIPGSSANLTGCNQGGNA